MRGERHTIFLFSLMRCENKMRASLHNSQGKQTSGSLAEMSSVALASRQLRSFVNSSAWVACSGKSGAASKESDSTLCAADLSDWRVCRQGRKMFPLAETGCEFLLPGNYLHTFAQLATSARVLAYMNSDRIFWMLAISDTSICGCAALVRPFVVPDCDQLEGCDFGLWRGARAVQRQRRSTPHRFCQVRWRDRTQSTMSAIRTPTAAFAGSTIPDGFREIWANCSWTQAVDLCGRSL